MLYCDEVARTEDEAIEAALSRMRLDRGEVIVRSVTEVPSGVKVRVEASRSRGQEALDILDEILHRMGIKSDLFYIEGYDRITINVKGDHLGLIIGKGGSTLEALERLVSAMHNHDCTQFKPVVINPGGYRENKRKALKTLVRRAVDAASDGGKVPLPVMKQRDRKQIHQIIKDFPGFRSRSIGEGEERRVFIYQAEDDESGMPDENEGEVGFIPPHDHSRHEGDFGSPSAGS